MTFATQISEAQVRALLDAMQRQQQDEVISLLDDLTRIRETELHQQLRQLTQNLHQTLDELGEDTPVLLHAKHDLPDITERLRYVIDQTQSASEQTLGAAENGLSYLEQIESLLDAAQTPELMAQISPLLQETAQALTQVMLAQSFQDLTGQVLNRVILVMTSLEESLKALIERSKYSYDAIPQRTVSAEQQKAQEEKGMGPNVTRNAQQDAVNAQEDVDDLLADLGI